MYFVFFYNSKTQCKYKKMKSINLILCCFVFAFTQSVLWLCGLVSFTLAVFIAELKPTIVSGTGSTSWIVVGAIKITKEGWLGEVHMHFYYILFASFNLTRLLGIVIRTMAVLCIERNALCWNTNRKDETKVEHFTHRIPIHMLEWCRWMSPW